MSTKLVNGVRVALTAQEQADFDARARSPLDVAKSVKAEMLSTLVDTLENGEITVNGQILSVADKAINRLMSAKTSLGNRPAKSIKYVTDRRNVVTINKIQADALHDAMMQYREEVSNRYGELLESINAATTVGEVDAIDIMAGWPDAG